MSGWKSGDVALVRISSDYLPEVAVSSDCQWFVAGPRLGSQHGWYHDRVEVVRPLAVIDPEDREAVEDVFRLVLKTLPKVGPTHRDYCDAMQAALREFANPTPPKPEPFKPGDVVRHCLSGADYTITEDCSLVDHRSGHIFDFGADWFARNVTSDNYTRVDVS